MTPDREEMLAAVEGLLKTPRHHAPTTAEREAVTALLIARREDAVRIAEMERERDEALQFAGGPSTLYDLAIAAKQPVYQAIESAATIERLTARVAELTDGLERACQLLRDLKYDNCADLYGKALADHISDADAGGGRGEGG